MTPTSSADPTNIIRDFMKNLRDMVTVLAKGDGDPERVIERIFAAAAAIGGVVLMSHPKTRSKGVWISSLFAIAMRLLPRKDQNASVTAEVTDPDHLHSK